METKKNKSDKMSKTQKVIVVLTAIILTVILILVLATRFLGSPDTYPVGGQGDGSAITGTEQTEPDDKDKPDGTDESQTGDNDGKPSDSAKPDGDTSDTGKPGGDTDKTDKENKGDSDGQDGTAPPATDPGEDDKDDDNKPSDPSDDGEDGDKPSDDEDDKNDTDNSGSNDDGQSGDLNGTSVSIVNIGESSITVSVGGQSVVIPVQTTVFNGRVTKSGVVSDTLGGYSIGASVMLYYPESEGLSGVTLSGAYVKADSSRLTVSGDYNGIGCKVVLRINGVRLP